MGRPGTPKDRLKPDTFLFELSEGMVQVGSSPGCNVLLSNLTTEEVDWLWSLRDGTLASKPLTDRQEKICRQLADKGLTVTDRSPLADKRVRIIGLDRVGTRIAHLLARTAVKSLDLVDRRLVDQSVEDLYPQESVGTSRQAALKRAIRARRPTFLISKTARPDLTFVCCERVWDHAIVGGLLSEDLNHLPIVAEQASATVGPLVAPGVTACAMCIDMHVHDQIPPWPEMSLALARSPLENSPDDIHMAAAALAVAMFEAVAAGVPPVPGGQVLGRVGGPSYAWEVTRSGPQVKVWRPHPKCACLGSALAVNASA